MGFLLFDTILESIRSKRGIVRDDVLFTKAGVDIASSLQYTAVLRLAYIESGH